MGERGRGQDGTLSGREWRSDASLGWVDASSGEVIGRERRRARACPLVEGAFGLSKARGRQVLRTAIQGYIG